MILSVSRRTDIPAYYSEWFINRLKAGYVCIKNPMNAFQISKVHLNPSVVDCIVFWSKNPQPIITRLDEINSMGYKYYFQFTITPYDKTLEPGLTDKRKIIETFFVLSERIGKNKVIWRYDPIILNEKLSIQYHIDAFGNMMSILSNVTTECIISFVDPYKKTRRQMGVKLVRDISKEEMNTIASEFSKIARNTSVKLKTCAEPIDLSQHGIDHASCIDQNKIENIIDCPLTKNVKKDSQREACGCMECIDLGAYNTCKNGCLYCYANISADAIKTNIQKHNPDSPLLIGEITEKEKVNDRKVKSLRVKNLTQALLKL